MLKKEKVYMPKDEALRVEIIRLHHDTPTEDNCHDSESNPQLSPAFIGLLNNLTDYNTTKSINRTGQVTLLCK